MEIDVIKVKSNSKEVIVRISSFLDRATILENKEAYIKKIIEDIKKYSDSKGFAGFKNEKEFRTYLNFFYREEIINKNYPLNKISLEKCTKLVIETVKKIHEFLEGKEIHLYIFPTIFKFTIEKMNGISGRLIWENIIYINIFPKKNWEKFFKSSLAHEIAHVLQKNYSYNMNIGEALVLEGMAEHFQENFLGKVKNPWTKVLSKKEAIRLFKKIKPILKKRDLNSYNEVFYGTGKYPLWAGYSMGYHAVEEYLKKHKTNWKQFLKEDPNKILNI